MPWGDWQFWLVTAAALLAVIFAVRTLFPRRKDKVKATLTIAGKPAVRPSKS